MQIGFRSQCHPCPQILPLGENHGCLTNLLPLWFHKGGKPNFRTHGLNALHNHHSVLDVGGPSPTPVPALHSPAQESLIPMGTAAKLLNPAQ